MKNYYDNTDSTRINGHRLSDIVLVDYLDCEHDYCNFCDSYGKKIVANFTTVDSCSEEHTVCSECIHTEECEYYAIHGHAEDAGSDEIGNCSVCNGRLHL